LESITSALVNGLYRLDIDVGDDQVVGVEHKVGSGGALLINTKDGSANQSGTVLVERVEGVSSNGSTNARSNSLASVSNKVGNLEDFGNLLLVGTIGDVELPVVRHLEGETSVVRGLDNDNISHEIGAEHEGDGLDHVGPLWDVSGEGEHGEGLIRAKHDKIGTEDNARLLGLVVIDLDSGVVRDTVGHDAGLITGNRGGGSGGSRLSAITAEVTEEEALDNLGKLLLQELLIGLQEASTTSDHGDLTGVDIADIDTLIVVERDGAAALEDLDLNRGDVVSGTIDHPAVSWLTRDLTILEGLTSAKEEGLLRVKDINILNARLETLSGGEEEGHLTLTELTLTKVLDSLDNGVQNHAVLTGSESGELNLSDETLMDVSQMGLSISEGDEPLLTSLTLLLKDIGECLNGLEVEGLLVGQDDGRDSLNDLLVNVGEVGTGLTDEPLLSSTTQNAVDILDLLAGTKTKGLVGLDDDSRNGGRNLNLNARGVSARSSEEPLITSQAGFSVKRAVANSAKAKGCVGCDYLQGRDVANQLLTRVQGKGRLLEADLLVAMTQLNLSTLLQDNIAVGITLGRVGNNTIVTGRNHGHWERVRQNRLVILASEGQRTKLNTSHIGVVVQYMNVVLRLDAVDRQLCSRGSSHSV